MGLFDSVTAVFFGRIDEIKKDCNSGYDRVTKNFENEGATPAVIDGAATTIKIANSVSLKVVDDFVKLGQNAMRTDVKVIDGFGVNGLGKMASGATSFVTGVIDTVTEAGTSLANPDKKDGKVKAAAGQVADSVVNIGKGIVSFCSGGYFCGDDEKEDVKPEQPKTSLSQLPQKNENKHAAPVNAISEAVADKDGIKFKYSDGKNFHFLIPDDAPPKKEQDVVLSTNKNEVVKPETKQDASTSQPEEKVDVAEIKLEKKLAAAEAEYEKGKTVVAPEPQPVVKQKQPVKNEQPEITSEGATVALEAAHIVVDEVRPNHEEAEDVQTPTYAPRRSGQKDLMDLLDDLEHKNFGETTETKGTPKERLEAALPKPTGKSTAEQAQEIMDLFNLDKVEHLPDNLPNEVLPPPEDNLPINNSTKIEELRNKSRSDVEELLALPPNPTK